MIDPRINYKDGGGNNGWHQMVLYRRQSFQSHHPI